MNSKITPKDSDMRGVLPALRRAARRAKAKAFAMGTPFCVMQDGKIVNLNPKGTLKKRRRRTDSK